MYSKHHEVLSEHAQDSGLRCRIMMIIDVFVIMHAQAESGWRCAS